MKKIIAMMVVVACVVGMNVPVVAAAGPVGVFGADKANVLKSCDVDDGEEGIKCVLRLAVTILSIGVGILGVIGISVAGIQYLTAGGSEEKTRKAKRRIYEIVIGLALYAVFFAALTWLLPGF
ncbi:MAG: hypothetical protein U0L97_04035 [Candidatus Saccharimonadaceae bacterium]|nr:hypothetical protein [Candidatus Saccharimonadaceae bacterium]